VAKPTGTIHKRTNNETIPPKHQGKTKKKNSAYTQLNGSSDSPREDKSLLTKIQIIDSSECPCGTGNQTVEHLIYECPKLQKERERERSPNKKHSKTRHLSQ
jgi:hypothetical protein